jgi:hypothetical protein
LALLSARGQSHSLLRLGHGGQKEKVVGERVWGVPLDVCVKSERGERERERVLRLLFIPCHAQPPFLEDGDVAGVAAGVAGRRRPAHCLCGRPGAGGRGPGGAAGGRLVSLCWVMTRGGAGSEKRRDEKRERAEPRTPPWQNPPAHAMPRPLITWRAIP